MKYIYRGEVVFDYNSQTKEVVTVQRESGIPNFNFCKITSEDCHLLSKYFELIGCHIEGQSIELIDIEVY
jgi:hypothetical protein